MSTTARDIVTEAFAELNVFDAGTAIPALDADFGLKKLNRIIGVWNTKGVALPAVTIATYTATSSLQPHTIGPSGATWTAARPTEVLEVNQILGSGTSAYRLPIALLDEPTFNNIRLKSFANAYPQVAWFNPTETKASLYFWPIPSSAITIELITRLALTALTLSTTFTMPDGYQQALTLTLAESLASAYQKQVPQQVAKEAREARTAIFDLNRKNHGTPRLTSDLGVPSDTTRSYNYLIGPFK